MAENDSVTGLAITIPEEVFNDLNRLEKKIMGLGTITNNISGNIVAAFKRMADGVDPFLSKVESAESALKLLGNVDISKSFSSIGKYSGDVEKATSSMTDMANTMNRVDFSTNIERADRRLKELVADLKVYEEFLNTPNTQNQIIAAEGIDQASREIREIIAVIPELEKLQSILNRNDLFQNYIDGINGATVESRRHKEEMEQLNSYYRELEKSSAKAAKEQERAAAQAAKAAEKQAKELAKLQEQQRKAYLQTPTGALESADNARSYAQRAQAMRNLEAAIKNLDSTEKNYQKTLNQLSTRYKQLKAEQDKVTQSLNGMRESQHHLMDTSGQLMRRLALVFSVSQVTQYVQKLAQVRGEFELQNAALAAIMQNKDEADQLFGQITQLAVQSPFQLKELVTYTKELAAYRIENEKLYDTTKMLADVSAGLGIDMSRLILALGQVKAANYLRGCLGYGTPIMLFNGDIKEVQNIVVGDVLINENGEPVNVLELIRGRETMFLVEQVTGHNRISYRVNRNHILTLWNVPDQKLEDVYVYDYLKNKDYYLGCRVINGKKEYYDIEVTKDRIDDYYGFVLDGNKRFRLGDGTITHNTELRQFSEAGINILGELATYFSEIENRAISVGEVFEMVSNRMVTFQDVEEIFRRITSEGGIFANMQEVQSRTLAGMISNMQDAVDVMLNEIGIASEDILKGSVSAVGDLVRNWREVAFMMKEAAIVIGPIAGYFVLARIASSKLGNALFTLATRIPLASKAMESFMAATLRAQQQSLIAGKVMQGFGNILGGLATLGVTAAISAITIALMNFIRTATKASREAKRLREEISGILSTDVTNINNSVVMYEELVEKLGQVNRGSGKHRDLIAQINSQYGEYLGYIVDETTSYEQLKDSIDSVTESMMKRSQMAAREKGLQAIYESTANDINKSQTELRETLSTSILSGLDRNATEKEINSIFGLFEKRVKETGGIIDSALELREILSEFYGKDVSVGILSTGMLINYSKALLRQKEGELYLQNQINDAYGEQYDTVEALNAIEANKDAREKALEAIREQTELTKWEQKQRENAINQQYDLQEIDLKVQYNVLTPEEGERQKQKLLNWATQTVEDVNDQVTKNLTSQGFSDELISRFLITPDMQSTGMPEIEKTVIASYQQATESIERFNRLKAAGNKIDEQQLQNVINQQKGWYAVAEALGIVDELNKKNGAGAKSALSEINKQIDAIKRAGKAYQDALKLYNETDAANKIERDYTALFEEVGLGNMIGTMEFDASGIIAALESLIKTASEKAGEAGSIAIQKAITDFKGEINVKARMEGIENVDEVFKDLMSGYNIALQLDETGLDKDAIAQMFGIDETTITGIRKKVEQAWIDVANAQEQAFAQMEGRAAITYTNVTAAVQSLGTEGVKAFQSQVDAMDDAIAKEQKKWMGLFVDYLANSVDEIKQVQNKGAVGISFAKQFFDEGMLSAEQYGTVIKNIIQDTNKEISKLNLEKFKESPEYIQAMGNLAAYSAGELQILLDKLQKFIAESSGNIDASDMEVYMDAIERVQEQIDNLKSPFQNNPFAQFRELISLEKEFDIAQAEHNELLQEREIRQQKVVALEQKLAELKKRQENGEDVSGEIWATDADLVSAVENFENINSEINQSESGLSIISGKIGQIAGTAGTTLGMVDLIIKGVGQSVEATVQLFGELKDLAASFGADTENGPWSDASIFFEGMGNFNQHVMQGWEDLKSGNVAGAVMNTFASIFDIIKGINSLHDNQREKIIIAETEKVENLERAYEKLQDSLSDINSTTQANELQSALESNYDQQIESYKKMIAAEQDKKDTDDERIKEYTQAIEDLEKQREEDLESILTTAGGVAKSEYLSVADEFVDAWITAFQETGDGLSGLEDNFDEFFLDLLKRQAAMQIASKWTNQIADNINKALEDDSMLTKDEGRKIIEEAMSSLPGLNEALKNYFAAYKDIVGDVESAEGSLSGLQKGIQGVTEETAQIIEALLNSMRYYVADTNAKLNSIYLMLSGTESVPNPMLVELRAQTEQLRAINRLIRNVTASGHPNGGDGIKIFMN